jgi:hypothetical protein
MEITEIEGGRGVPASKAAVIYKNFKKEIQIKKYYQI